MALQDFAHYPEDKQWQTPSVVPQERKPLVKRVVSQRKANKRTAAAAIRISGRYPVRLDFLFELMVSELCKGAPYQRGVLGKKMNRYRRC